ncbi:MAG TPA: thioredoxin domain-containing protein [Candidatus Pelagibacter bacterium]|jgi:protein-disulfide isomerase|nr:thioredoxin domain-containing protein [Candidatus Pelagibacter bacterium]|tara:strand:- start:389 stop:970 length:582 start_codon:yes stop_codon:yes gene_type:complete
MKKIIITTLFIAFYFLPINLKAEVKPISEGNVDAKIKIVVFESLTCSHCANFHKNVYPNLKEDFIDKGNVYIEFKNFPLDMAAMNASKIAHCKNDGNSEILHYLFDNQRQWLKGKTIEELNTNIKNFIEKSDFNLDIDVCLSNKEAEDHILEDRIEGVKKFKVDATPTLIINGEKFDNPTNYKKLKKFLEKLI